MFLRTAFPYTAAAFAVAFLLWSIGGFVAALCDQRDLADKIVFLGIGPVLVIMVIASGCYLFGYVTPIDDPLHKRR